MEESPISEARVHLLVNALDTNLAAELYDIINCNIFKVVRSISPKDIIALGQFIRLPLDENGQIIFSGARQQISLLLSNHPSFRSQNPETVCASLAHYFSANPVQQIQAPSSPAWANHYLNSPQRTNNNNEIPRPPSFE